MKFQSYEKVEKRNSNRLSRAENGVDDKKRTDVNEVAAERTYAYSQTQF